MPTAHDVGERLAQLRREKSARERRDVLQEEVAADVGVSEEAYNRYEKGRRMPKPAIFARIAEYWGVTERWLHYGPETKTPSIPEGVTLEPHSKSEDTAPTGAAHRRPRDRAGGDR